MAKLKIQHTSGGIVHDRYASPITISGNHIGGVGGDTSQAVSTIATTVKIGTNSAASGYILHQKGAHKFRVTDGTHTGVCTLVNLATPTAANTMSIIVTKQNATTFRASRITNKWVYDFAGNKYRYWFASATTNNAYPVDAKAGVVGFVQVANS